MRNESSLKNFERFQDFGGDQINRNTTPGRNNTQGQKNSGNQTPGAGGRHIHEVILGSDSESMGVGTTFRGDILAESRRSGQKKSPCLGPTKPKDKSNDGCFKNSVHPNGFKLDPWNDEIPMNSQRNPTCLLRFFNWRTLRFSEFYFFENISRLSREWQRK